MVAFLLTCALSLACMPLQADLTPDAAGPSRTDGDGGVRGDFETGDAGQFDSLECAHPDRQFRIVSDPVRQGRYAARFEQGPGDAWDNGSIRCLAAIYDSGEQQGDEYYYGFSVFFPAGVSDNTLWELHARKEIYEVDPDTSVSPHAVEIVDGALVYRLLSGPAYWDGSDWTGWSHYEPALPLLASPPVATWIDVIVHIRFSQFDDGALQVWVRTGNGGWTERPQLERTDLPTLQWIPGYDDRIWGYRNDPRVPEDIPAGSLYTELGIYKGEDRTETVDVVYHDGYRRGTSLESTRARFR